MQKIKIKPNIHEKIQSGFLRPLGDTTLEKETFIVHTLVP